MNDGGKILMLGAGPIQIGAIKRAKELGYYVIALDEDPDAPGLQLADKFGVLDIRELEPCVAYAQQENVDGAICVAVDAAIRSTAAVVESLGLPGLSSEGAFNATSKQRMRECWAKSDVPSTGFQACLTEGDAIEAFDEFGGVVVIKPSDSAGSRGVTWVDNLALVPEAFKRAMEFSRDRVVLVEEYMQGTEISVEAVMSGDVFYPIALSDKNRTEPPYLLDLAVLFPSQKSDEIQREAISIVERAARALKVDMSPIHAELMVTPDGLRMVELAARGPGFKVFTDMIPWSSGLDVISESLRMAMGEPVQFSSFARRGAALLFPQRPPVTVKKISGLDAARGVPGIHDLELYVSVGDTIKPLTFGANRVGHIIALAETRLLAEAAVAEAEGLVKIEG